MQWNQHMFEHYGIIIAVKSPGSNPLDLLQAIFLTILMALQINFSLELVRECRQNQTCYEPQTENQKSYSKASGFGL